MTVTTMLDDGVLLITIDNPPVNALGKTVREGLTLALDLIDRDHSIVAAVLAGAGKTFCGGADIKEFGKPPVEPYLPDILLRLEQYRIPVVAAMGGAAMGGGFEMALACRYRIAGPRARLALPEVKLGLIPGAGGTQRLPRLAGVKHAAEMITSGKPVSAQQALEMGLVDELADGDLIERACNYARNVAKEALRPPLSTIEKPADWDGDWLNAFEKKCKARARGQLSPLKALEAVRASGTLSFTEGLARERELFLDCMKSDQREGLIHAFFAERAATKIPALEGGAPRDIETIAILGAGTMGAGITIACAQSGYCVKIFDTNNGALSAGVARIHKTIEANAAKGRMSAEDASAAIDRVISVAAMEDFDDADLIIEAVVEKMDVKKSVFSRLDRIAKPGAVLASNTSYLNIDEIAAATNRPGDVIGMHFFSPANLMCLLEVVKTKHAEPDALATAMGVGKKLGKVCVVSGVCDGFIGNRIFKKYRQQADYLIEDGALPQQVDRVMREFGFAMGPFEVSDLAGLDIGWHNRRREDAARDPDERYVALADKLYEINRLGQKTRAGWYRYESGDRTPHADPIVEELILQASRDKGISRHKIGDDEIRDRILFAMINEGAKILEEGIAARSLDIDTVFLHGYGFPAYRGGPMFYADQIGLQKVVDGINHFAADDPNSWGLSALLKSLAGNENSFSGLENTQKY